MSEAKVTLDALMLSAVNAVRSNDEEGSISAAAGLATFSLFQLIRVADAMEKLAGLMDTTVANVAEVEPFKSATEQFPTAPYGRPECLHRYCLERDVCRADDRCHNPAGWGAPPSL